MDFYSQTSLPSSRGPRKVKWTVFSLVGSHSTTLRSWRIARAQYIFELKSSGGV